MLKLSHLSDNSRRKNLRVLNIIKPEGTKPSLIRKFEILQKVYMYCTEIKLIGVFHFDDKWFYRCKYFSNKI